MSFPFTGFRRYRLFLCLLTSLVPWSGLEAEDAGNGGEEKKPEETGQRSNHLGFRDALVLGLVEGVTEYLPISSTGHLILTNRWLGLDSDTPLKDARGNPVWLEKPSEENPDGEAFTLKAAANGYAIIIQAGAIAAVLLLYWRDVMSIVRGFLGKDRNGLLLGRNLALAFAPAVVLGLAFEDLIDRYLFGTTPVVIALVAGAFLMLGVEWWRKKKNPGVNGGGIRMHELTVWKALFIGLLQCVAMWPGTSRSMMTIVGGYLVGLPPRRAAEFSFLLGLITLSAAAGYKGLKVGPALFTAFDPLPILFGCLVAAISAAFAIKWMVTYLTRHGLAIFAYYRIAIAILVVALVTRA